MFHYSASRYKLHFVILLGTLAFSVWDLFSVLILENSYLLKYSPTVSIVPPLSSSGSSMRPTLTASLLCVESHQQSPRPHLGGHFRSVFDSHPAELLPSPCGGETVGMGYAGLGQELGLLPTEVTSVPHHSCLPQTLVPNPWVRLSSWRPCQHLDLPFFPCAKWFLIIQHVFHFVSVVQDYRCFLMSLNVEFVSLFIFFVLLSHFWEKWYRNDLKPELLYIHSFLCSSLSFAPTTAPKLFSLRSSKASMLTDLMVIFLSGLVEHRAAWFTLAVPSLRHCSVLFADAKPFPPVPGSAARWLHWLLPIRPRTECCWVES